MRLTELSVVQDVLVEQDNTGTQSNPDTIIITLLAHTHHRYFFFPGKMNKGHVSRHVNGRVEGRLGRFGLVGGGVDRRQARLRTRDLARLSGLFTFVAHDGRGRTGRRGLVRDEVLEIKRTRP